MKKFFKSLAVVLALVLVLSAVPVSAATAPELSAKTKILYLGGSKGTTVTGVKCATGETKKIQNMITGFNSKTMKLNVKSNDESVVTVDTDTNTIKAVKMGTAIVTVVVTDTATATPILFDSITVTVKKNATNDTIAIQGIEDGATVKLSDVLTVKMPRLGVYTDTAVLKADSENVVITPAADARVWNVSFTKPGDYTLTGYTFQSASYAGVTASKDIKVKVAGTTYKSLRQTAGDTIELVFDGDVSDQKVDAKDVRIYSKIQNFILNNVKAIKSVSVKENKIIVNAYSAFSAGTTYYVEFDGSEYSFVGAKNDESEIAYFVIDDMITISKQYNQLTCSFYNKDGVKLNVKPSNLTFEAKSKSGNPILSSTGSLYFTKDNDTIEVNAYFYRYSTANGKYTSERIDASATNVFFGQKQANYTGEVIAKVSKNATVGSKDDEVALITIGTQAYFDLFFEVFDVKAGKTTDPESAWKAGNGNYKFYSSNEKIFVMNGNKIIPLHEGDAYIQVVDDKDSAKPIVYSHLIHIEGARKADHFVVEAAPDLKLNINAAAKDSVSFTIKVYDQYGDLFAGDTKLNIKECAGVTAYKYTNNVTVNGSKTITLGTTTNSDVKLNDGETYAVLEVSDPNKKMASSQVFFAVANYDDAKIDHYAISGQKDVDVAVNTKSFVKDHDGKDGLQKTTQFELSVDAVSASGFKVKDVTGIAYAAEVPEAKATSAPLAKAGENNVAYKLVLKDSDNKIYSTDTALNGAKYLTFTSAGITVNPIVDNNGSVQKMPAKTYTLTLYRVTEDGKATYVDVMDVQSFTISDSQTKVVAKVGKYAGVALTKDSSQSAANTLFQNSYTFSLNGEAVDKSCVTIININDAKEKNWEVDDYTGVVVFKKAYANIKLADGTELSGVAVDGLPDAIRPNN